MSSIYKTRQLTEGAIMAVITAIVALLGTFIPLLNTLTVMVITAPIIFVIVRNNLSTGVLSSIVAAFLVGIIAGPIASIFFYIQFMFLAIVYGYLFRKESSVATFLSVGTVVSVTATILVFLLVMITGQISFEEQKEVFNEAMERTIIQYEESGVFDDLKNQGYSQEEIRTMLDGMIKFVINIIPTIIVIASALTAILNFVFSRLLLKKFNHKVPVFPKFTEWRMPWNFIWGFIVAWGVLLFGDVIDNPAVLIIGQNVLIAYGAAFFIMGLSTMAYIFKNAEISPIARIAFVFLIFFLFQSIVVITAFIGLLDLLLDTRKKIAERKEGKK
jgi:uncharacterized protein YybS (DUF2232 family)